MPKLILRLPKHHINYDPNFLCSCHWSISIYRFRLGLYLGKLNKPFANLIRSHIELFVPMHITKGYYLLNIRIGECYKDSSFVEKAMKGQVCPN